MSTEHQPYQLDFLAPQDVELLHLMRRMVADASRIYEAKHAPPLPSQAFIRHPADAAAILMPEMSGLVQEQIRILTLTIKNQVISAPTIYVGNISNAIVRAAEVFRPAILDAAAGILIAHNHPSGDPTPSPEDIAVTRKLAEAGKLLDIEVKDHIVIGRDNWVSLRELGMGGLT